MPPSLLITLIAALLTTAHSQSASTYANCDRGFSCGDIINVTFPFTGGSRPSYCGLPGFTLSCRRDTVTELTDGPVTYRVIRVDQTRNTLILSRLDLYGVTCPTRFRNTTFSTLFFYSSTQNEALSLFYGCNTSGMSIRPFNLFSCNSSGLNFTDSYGLLGPFPDDPVMRIIYCSTSMNVPLLRAAASGLRNRTLSLREALMQGFEVSYSVPHERMCSECSRLGGQCAFDSIMGQPVCICGDRPCDFPLTLTPNPTPAPYPPFAEPSRSAPVGIIVGSIVGAVICVITSTVIILCCLKGRLSPESANQERHKDVEKFFLENGLAPKRYKYSEIKKATKSFSYKLGQGGYGSVYKGTLPDGSLVAVKVLIEADSDGDEFINEVASISRTSHVNIVSLLGFCYEKNKRAIIYEFMPNKSLDKFLSKMSSAPNADCGLDLKQLFKIAVGIAKGLEYLHTSCSTRIVHFDIKPQNILLDEDMCPKISDFGLAKLCKKKQSILSVLGTRGTIGYIAPEVFSRNFGGVSHKSDVYSYGMMLLEMAGAGNIAEPSTVQSSENYFPDKIYAHAIDGVTRRVESLLSEDGEEIAKKMYLVGFWCIQTNPTDRPSMVKVVEMLEGSVVSIGIPPKPVLCTHAPPLQNISSSFVDTQSSAEG